MVDNKMPLDYFVNITLSNDKLFAYIHFTNCDDRFSCTLEQLEGLLKIHHIVHGVHQDVLEQIARNTRAFIPVKTVIATGTSPINGEDGRIIHLFDLENDSKRPVEQEDGTVNYKEVTALNNVRKGDIVSRRIPAKEGTDGRAVTGEPIFAQKGKEARFRLGKNVVTDAEQLTAIAVTDGMVSKTERDRINVFPVYEIRGDIDYTVGNIDFVGTVVIRGSVLYGFKVKSAGDIRIIGGVEGAEVEAGGSIDISAGILGQNKAVIRAGGSIRSTFIQDAFISAGEDVVVSQSIMHSTIRAGRGVICQGTKGLIVGGSIQAGEKVAARTIGNSMSTNTVIEVGVLPELRNELQNLRLQLKAINDNLQKTEKALGILDQLAISGQLTPDKLAMRIKFLNTKKSGQEDLNMIKDRMLEIEKSLEDTDKARVEVVGTIYGGTKIVIGRYTKFVKDPLHRVYFRMSDNDISTHPLN